MICSEKNMQANKRVAKTAILQKLYQKSIRTTKNRNHKGSTLLMVIICLAFIGILGSLMLSVSMVNYQMKRVESSSRDNFYSCEKALEEIRAGLDVKSTIEIQKVYEEVLKDYIFYAAKDDNDRSTEIKIKVFDGIKAMIDDIDLKEDLLSLKTGYTINHGTVDISDKPNSIILHDVNIVYVENNYKTSITSDIRITIPNFTLVEGSETVINSMPQPYEGYALAADGYILSENSGGENTINGNVYAGEGITVRDTGLLQNHTLTMTGKYITTRGNILDKDTATLNIESGTQPTLLSADNLVVDTSSYLQSITATSMNINAICLIKDDLTLEGRNSTVNFNGGAYIGYSSAGIDSTKGSSIIINGAGSSLDLSKLSSLLLAGRAHVSIENSNGETISSIMTGESLALKSNQRAYLVPGANIYLGANSSDPGVPANHNPITDKDLSETDPYKKVLISDEDLKTYLGIPDKKEYLNKTSAFQVISKQTTVGASVSKLYYYYLLFSSGKMADEYFWDYKTKYDNVLQSMDTFPLGNVIIPSNNVYSAGNVMSYDADKSELSYHLGLSGSYASDELLNQALQEKNFSDIDDDVHPIFNNTFLNENHLTKISDITNLYKQLTHYLSPETDDRNFNEDDKAIRYTMKDMGNVQVMAEYLPYLDTILSGTEFKYKNSIPSDSSEKSIIVMNSNINIPDNSHINGLLITSGDITIGKNVVINGLIVAARSMKDDGTYIPHNITVGDGTNVHGRIIATGDIILGRDCTIDCTQNTAIQGAASNDTVESFLSNMFDKANILLWKLFVSSTTEVGIPKDGDSYLVNIKNLVTCENWRKN